MFKNGSYREPVLSTFIKQMDVGPGLKMNHICMIKGGLEESYSKLEHISWSKKASTNLKRAFGCEKNDTRLDLFFCFFFHAEKNFQAYFT